MEEYFKLAVRKSKNDYPHIPENYYPYGYQSKYVEESKDENGEIVKNVYFLPPHEKEVLQIYNYGEGDLEEFSLVEEQENGESFVLMTGEMMDGVLEGYCQIFEPDKGLVFEGNWSNNMRCGTCVEYDYECVSFQGNYRNDKRNGYGWEYDQDELQREGVWIDGVYQQAYRIVWEENFVGVGLGMHITLTDNDTHITTVRWEDGKCNGRALTYSKNENRVIQERVYMHGDDIDVVPISQPAARRGVLKFPNGSTWEGDISLDAACGEGSLFSPEGTLLYRGGMFRNRRFGRGTSFHPNGKPAFEGLWSEDVRMGDGRSFTERGEVEKEGVWVDDAFAERVLDVPSGTDAVRCTVLLRELSVGDNALNEVVELDFRRFALLERVRIGANSLKELGELNFSNLQRLRSVEIGEDACTLCARLISPLHAPKERQDLQAKSLSLNEGRVREEMKRMVIANCPALESVVLERNACSDFLNCTIEEVPKLRELHIGRVDKNVCEVMSSLNFLYCDTFELIGLPALEVLELGNHAFFYVKTLRLHDLKSLKKIELGSKACFGIKERVKEVLVNSSRMSFRNLPALESMSFVNNFVFFSKCCFENIPNCHQVSIRSRTFPPEKFPIEYGEGLSQEIREKIVNSK